MQQEEKLILRVFSKAGRSRVEIGVTKTLNDMKADLAKRLGLPSAAAVRLFKDDKCRQPLGGRDTDRMNRLGLKNGDILHVAGETQMTALPPPPKQIVRMDEKKEEEKKEEEKVEVRKDSYGRVLKTVDEKKDDGKPVTDSYGRVLKAVPGKDAPKKDVKMIATASDDRKKEMDDDKFVKHESFDGHIAK
jgi:hypothetical protein